MSGMNSHHSHSHIPASRMVWILDRDDTQLDEGVAVMVMVMVEVAKVVTVDWAVVAYVPVLPKHARVSSRDSRQRF